MAFNVGTCKLAFSDNPILNLAHTAAVTAWTPIYKAGLGVLIAIATAAANASAGYYRRGIFSFIIANGVTIAIGDRVYYNSSAGTITTTAPAVGFLLGTCTYGGTGNSTGTVLADVDINLFGVEGAINVYGSTGLFKASYATIDLAVAALADNDVLRIKSGSYTLGASCVIASTGVKIVGEGVVEITGAAGADNCFSIVLGALSSTAEVWFKNIIVSHTDDATQVGIQIDNLAATKKLNVYVDDCEFDSDGGNSIDIDHSDTSNAIRLYCNRSTFEGPVNVVVADAGDRFRFVNSVVRGGFVSSAGDFDAEILFHNCVVKHEGVTGGHANQRVISLGSYTETDADPNVYGALDTNDLAGSHTEQIVA